MKLGILRRSATVVAGATAVVLVGAGIALADVSPSQPSSTGNDTMYWSGQGAPVQQFCGSNADFGGVTDLGSATANNYELWIFGMDHGAVSGTPTLTVNGTTYTNAIQNGGEWHIVTPYIDPSTITPAVAPNGTGSAFTTFVVSNVGTGNWKLVISHGCAGPGQASSPTVQKNAAGAYQTNWAWSIKKTAAPTQANAPPSQQVPVTYTVVVTGTSTNNQIVVTGTIDIKNPNSVPIPTFNAVDQLSPNLGPCTFTPPAQLAPGDNNIPYTCNLPDNSNLNGLTNTITVSWPQQTLSDGSQLAASGSNPATFTTPPITFTQGQVTDNCATVSDPAAPANSLGQVCSSDLNSSGQKTFTYTVDYNTQANPDTPGTCTTHNNTATIKANDSGANSSDSASVQVCVGAPLTVTKTAQPAFQRQYGWTIKKNVDHTQFNIPADPGSTNGTATANYDVQVSHDAGTDSGWVVTGTITVSNPNDWEDINLTDLKDAIDNGGTCTVDGSPGLTIPQGKSVTYNYKCTYDNPPTASLGHNTATATWDNTKYFTDPSQASGEKDADFSSVTPTLVDDCISVTDTQVTGILGKACVSDGINPEDFTYQKVFTDPGGTCTTHNNMATFTTNDTGTTSSASQSVQVCVGLDLTVQKTATPTLTNKFKWDVTKSVDNPAFLGPQPGIFTYHVSVHHDNGTLGNWNVGGTLTVSNPNDFEDITVNPLQDVIQGEPNASCLVSPAGSVTIPRSGSSSFSYDCSYTAAPAADHQTNAATATWDQSQAGTPSGSATGLADWLWSGQTPSIIDGSVQVFDTVDGGAPQLLGTANLSDPNPKVFTYTRQFNNDPGGSCTIHKNQASVTTNMLNVTTPSNIVTVQDCIGVDLGVSKTATPSFNRTYLWSISKTETPPLISPGGTAMYSVTVSQTGVKDGSWVVTGKITVTNSNNFEPISLATLSDKVDNGTATCTIGGPTLPVSIPASGSQVFPYTCTYSSAPTNPTGTNTATGTWTGGGTPDTSALGMATFTFSNPTTTNKTITPQDSFNGGPPVNLCTLDTTQPCTLTGTDSSPFTSATYNYSRQIQPPANGCQVFPNTATIKETAQSSSAKVTECSVGGLTMGFWHNTNGQNIIKNGASTGGVCNSGTWLRQYAPFADLSATATCSQVATYFSNVWSLANAAGGGTAMLKAQMLATALNVYFSDPHLGGNQIGAWNGNGNNQVPIGSIKINTTAWSSAFGGATSMTVQQMLNYAASQFNVPGGWYGGNKTTVTTAIAAFNAINNDQVTIAP